MWQYKDSPKKASKEFAISSKLFLSTVKSNISNYTYLLSLSFKSPWREIVLLHGLCMDNRFIWPDTKSWKVIKFSSPLPLHKQPNKLAGFENYAFSIEWDPCSKVPQWRIQHPFSRPLNHPPRRRPDTIILWNPVGIRHWTHCTEQKQQLWKIAVFKKESFLRVKRKHFSVFLSVSKSAHNKKVI